VLLNIPAERISGVFQGCNGTVDLDFESLWVRSVVSELIRIND
jgi:hypothetical protein